jgi:hypothetical protein
MSELGSNVNTAPMSIATINPGVVSDAEKNKLINSFYQRFYPAHPIIVPRAFYLSQQYPNYLELVMCFIGQQYQSAPGLVPNQLTGSNPVNFQHLASLAMLESKDEDTVHRVQALILYSIALHGRHQTKEAEGCVARATRIALMLGLNRPDFTRDAPVQDLKRDESFRRTWWELYTIDAYIAALHRKPMFTSSNIKPLPLLPCAQSDFELYDLDVPPVSLGTFSGRVFADESVVFSSYCYRIEAARIIERVLSLSALESAEPDEIQNVDNAIASWKYHLPNHGDTLIQASGDVDPLLFQAHFMIHCATIFLHFPRSELPATIPSTNDIACAKGYRQLPPTSSHHTVKTINASKEITNLASIPGQLDQHSPFFSCGLILSCIVQLAAASTHLHSSGSRCLQQHRDRVILILGVLKCLGPTWAVAHNAVQQLRVVANTIFSADSQEECVPTTNSSIHDSALDLGELPDSLSWFDLLAPGELEESLMAFSNTRT